MSQKQVEITDVGPIRRLMLPIPEDGGIVVMRGANGVGKTKALDAVNALVTGRGRLPVRDGALKSEVRGFGVTLTIGRSTRRTGEAEVHSIESRLSVADLVDPGIADPEKADAHRIKALVNLASAKADPSLFYDLVGGPKQFDALVSPSATTHPDLVAMAGAIKRDLEAASRRSASEATNARARADAARKSAELPEGIDPEQEADAKILQRELQAAMGEKSKLEAEQQSRAKVIAQAEHSRGSLAKLESEYKGASPELAAKELEAAREIVAEMERGCIAALESLRETQARHKTAIASLESKAQAKQAADSYAAAVKFSRDAIDAGAAVQPVKAGDLVRARAAVDDAGERIEQAALIRRAKAAQIEAQQTDEIAAEHQAKADQLRQAARGVDDVLSGVVARSGVPLRIEPVENRMRLTLETSRGPHTPFGDLSDGERWRIALDIAIKAVGRNGEITIQQSAWEGLDGRNRRAIAEQAKAGGIVIYTAECSEGDLRAEVFSANGTK